MNYPKIIKRMADVLFLCVEATIFEYLSFEEQGQEPKPDTLRSKDNYNS